MNLKIVLSKIDTYSDKLLHGRSPSLWRSAATPWHYDAVQVRPSTPSRMEDVLAQPRRWNRRNGSLCRSDAFVSASLCLLILKHGRRQSVTAHPTAEWIARQLTEARGWDGTPEYLVRDHDSVYGAIFTRRVRAMSLRDRPIAPRSPWQNGHVERLIGSLRRECLDHVIVFGERASCCDQTMFEYSIIKPRRVAH